MNRIARLATTMLVSGGLGLAGLGASTAYADPGYIDPIGPYHWCPGGRPWTSIGTRLSATPIGTSLPARVMSAGLAIVITTSGRDPIHRGYLKVRASPCGSRPLAPTANGSRAVSRQHGMRVIAMTSAGTTA